MRIFLIAVTLALQLEGPKAGFIYTESVSRGASDLINENLFHLTLGAHSVSTSARSALAEPISASLGLGNTTKATSIGF